MVPAVSGPRMYRRSARTTYGATADASLPRTTEAMAELRGAPGFPYATTQHPVAVLSEDQVKERAAGVVDAVVALLTEKAQLTEKEA